jgi:hypothetical protein
MIETGAPSRRLLAGSLAVLLLVAACGGAVNQAASPGVSAGASPTQAATSSPTASVPPAGSASASPSASPATDVATGIEIGAPYVLTGNPGSTALSGTYNVDVAGKRVEALMNGREIRQDSKVVGLVLVMKFSGTTITPQFFDLAAKQAASNSGGGKVTFSTILGNRVAFVTATGASYGLYARGDSILMVGGPTGTDAKTLLTSVINANQ